MKFLINILNPLRIGLIAVWFFGLTACAQADPGTRAEREALFDVIVAKIMAREAFSSIKNQRLGLSFPESLEAHRAAFIDAKTDEELYWALVRLTL